MLRSPVRSYETPRGDGVDMMHDILKRVWEEEQMQDKWETSELVPYTSKRRTHKNVGTLEALRCWNMT